MNLTEILDQSKESIDVYKYENPTVTVFITFFKNWGNEIRMSSLDTDYLKIYHAWGQVAGSPNYNAVNAIHTVYKNKPVNNQQRWYQN